MRYVLLDPTARDFIWDWENRARRLLAEFRADTAHDPDDRAMRDLVDGLERDSEAFGQFWNNHAVLAREARARVQPSLGRDAPLRAGDPGSGFHPGHKVVMLLPTAG